MKWSQSVTTSHQSQKARLVARTKLNTSVNIEAQLQLIVPNLSVFAAIQKQSNQLALRSTSPFSPQFPCPR
jgi:hypothetical protein